MKKKLQILILLLSSFVFGQTHSILSLNESLPKGSSISSENSLFQLIVEGGSLILKSNYKKCIKWSREIPEGSSVVLNSSGLVVEGSGEVLVSASGAFELIVENSGDLIIYNQNKKVLWSSGTTDIADYDRNSVGRLSVGESLQSGKYLVSKNNQFKMHLGKDGNLVLLGVRSSQSCNPELLWQSNTSGSFADKLELRDASLVLTSKGVTVFEQSWTSGFSGELVLSDDGSLSVERADDTVLWQAETDREGWAVDAPTPLQFYEELHNKCVKLSYGTAREDFSVSSTPSDYHIYIKEDYLGKAGYSLFNKSKSMLSTDESGEGVAMGSTGAKSLWMIEDVANTSSFSGKAFFKNASSGKYLQQLEDKSFALTYDKAKALQMNVLASDNCWYQPVDLGVTEMANNNKIAGKESFAKEINGNELYGAAEMHSHAMAYFSIGGSAIHGKIFDEDGIEEALPDSFWVHGPQGIFNFMDLFFKPTAMRPLGDYFSNNFNENAWLFWNEKFWKEMPDRFEKNLLILEELATGEALHMYNTAGYPEFTSWPAWDKGTTQSFYYEWLNRARIGGLKMINILAQESRGGCKLLEFGYDMLFPVDPLGLIITRPDCDRTEMEVVNLQLDEIDKLEDYIKRKEGGWLEVVTSSEQARRAVSEGKLAVIKGIEAAALFDCINWVGEYREGRQPCTKSYIEQQVKILKDKRVTYIFPLHHYDNDFGGSYGFHQNAGVSLLNFAATGTAFLPERCDLVGQGLSKAFLRKGDALADIIKITLGPLVAAEDFGDAFEFGEFPDTPPVDLSTEPGWCSALGLSPLGKDLIQLLMENGMFIDIDHVSPKSKLDAYKMLAKYDYPISSSHFRIFGDLNKHIKFDKQKNPNDYAGIKPIYSEKFNGFEAVLVSTGSSLDDCPSSTSISIFGNIQSHAKNHLENSIYAYPAYILGTDFGGGPTLSAPRFPENKFSVNFECKQDPNTKLSYPFVSFDGKYIFDRMTSGYRSFDYNTDGMSTIGQFPDMVADMQAMGYSDEEISPMFRGAELVVRVWEKMEEASKKVRAAKNSRVAEDLPVALFPTMVDDRFNLENKSSKPINVSIYNEKGNIVGSWKFGSEKDIAINELSHLTKGIYFVNITDESGNKNKSVKIIKN